MNVIVIMADSLRVDHLGCYGNEWIQTPSLDRFATSLEFRFSRAEIRDMFAKVGLYDVRFSETVPFWKVVGQRPSQAEDRVE